MAARPAHLMLLLIIVGLLLSACGQQAQAVPTALPPPTAPPTAPPATSDLAGIPQGTTEEGYRLLGAADAPVTLVMYSDFF